MLPVKPGMGTNVVKYISPGLPCPNPASRTTGLHSILIPNRASVEVPVVLMNYV